MTDRRSRNASILRDEEQRKKKDRIRAVIRRKERQIQMRRDIVDYILKEAVKRFRYRTWIILINFVQCGEEIFSTIKVKNPQFFPF